MNERTLIERLNIPWPEHETEEVTLPAWVIELCAEGAARIAALEAENERLKEVLEMIDRIALTSAEQATAEPVAYTTQKYLDAVQANRHGLMWREPMPYHPDIPLYTHPSPFEARLREALEDAEAAMRFVYTSCATEGCDRPATVRFERGGVGSEYCYPCYLKVQALAQEDGR